MKARLILEHMRLDYEGRIAWLTFTRERYLNAMGNAAAIEINEVAATLRDDATVRVVVIRGQGRAFCTGIDLKELAAGQIEMVYHHRWERALRQFETMDKIVIAAMHGHCLGGGLQLALACDIRVSTPDCEIGLPAIKESLIPGMSTWRLPGYVGWGRAKQLVLSGQNMSGNEAARIGLVDHVVPAENYESGVDGVVRQYLASCSYGTRMSKVLIAKADRDYESALGRYFELQEQVAGSADAAEAKRAYLEKRAPRWT